MIGWWAALRSVGEVLEGVLRAVPAWGWTLALGLALGAAGHAHLTGPDRSGQGLPEIEYKDEPIVEGDLSPPTMPDRIEEYAAPDSQDIRTDCIQVPSWLPQIATSSTPERDSASARSDRKISTPQPEISSHPTLGRISGPPYVITPMTEGYPALSVGPRQVRLSTILPSSGRGRIYTWAVPQEDTRLAADVGVRAWPEALSARAEGRLGRVLLRAGPVDVWGSVGAGYRSTSRPSPMQGPYGTVGVTVELSW